MVIGCLEVRFLGALYVGSHSSIITRGIWASISPDLSLACMSRMGICAGQCLPGRLSVRHSLDAPWSFFGGQVAAGLHHVGSTLLTCRVASVSDGGFRGLTCCQKYFKIYQKNRLRFYLEYGTFA